MEREDFKITKIMAETKDYAVVEVKSGRFTIINKDSLDKAKTELVRNRLTAHCYEDQACKK